MTNPWPHPSARPTPIAPAATAVPAPLRVYLTSLGCRLNEAEMTSWARGFAQRGHTLASAPEGADLLVLNTCAVTAEAVAKSRQLLRRAGQANPAARMVVTGCFSTLSPEVAEALGATRVVANGDKDRLVDLCLGEGDADAAIRARGPALAEAVGAMTAASLPRSPIHFLSATAAPSTPSASLAALTARGRHRAFVKVQDGCRHRCTFCLVTLARGAERSRPLAEVVAEVAAWAAAGIKEVILTGVHLAGYGAGYGIGYGAAGLGTGLDTGDRASAKEGTGASLGAKHGYGNGTSTGADVDLATLLGALLAETHIPRIRLGSLEPWDWPPGLLDRFADPRLQPHLHLPLQSGADPVLRRMGRRCRAVGFRALVTEARARIPGLLVTTDLIAGFPGETEADHAATLAFIEEVGIAGVHAFAYSPRPGTAAATLADQVPVAVARRRRAEIAACAGRLQRAALDAAVGQIHPVLLEGVARHRAAAPHGIAPAATHGGYTPHYLRVEIAAPAGQTLAHRILPVRITGVAPTGDRLLGRLA